MVKNGPNTKVNVSNTANLIPPFTFHHLKMRFSRDSINKRQEQNKVTGKYLLKDFLGRKNMTVAHKMIALNILKKLANKITTVRFIFRMW